MISLRRSAAVLSLLATFALGCGPSRTAAEAKADLSAADAEIRLKAARDIETESKNTKALPTDVMEQLLSLAKTEEDPKVKGSIMIGLGYTGDARAKDLIKEYAQTSDPDQQRWAGRAWSWWLIRSGEFEEGHKFPPKFPYGTEGFPEPAKK
ncbi:MAG: HEAT repeat domain-containing protein [Myxococcales bacterium]|nr:HEAT repeat domain-containing protein [Myxococcales bacterium]